MNEDVRRHNEVMALEKKCQKGAELVHKDGWRLAKAVPLEDFQNIVEYARKLESECADLSAGACPHVVGDDFGNPVCGLIVKGLKTLG